MSVELITSKTVIVEGSSVHLRGNHLPHHIRGLIDGWDQTEPEFDRGDSIQDTILDLRQGHLPLIKRDYEYEAYQQVPLFTELARRAATERGVSYRDFKVGASAYAVSGDGSRIGYLFGANLTPHQGATKRCAEMEVLQKARETGFDRIVALATFGPSDFGDVNTVKTLTLHPCAECRALLDSDPLVRDDTLIITGNEKGQTELMLKADLIKLHTAA